MSEKKYHHGGLEEDLITKGIQLLAREGYEGFSMRKLAALCGVSHAAPYKHFKGKNEIIAAIAARISREFSAALQAAADACPDDPRQRMAELCVQYVAFLTTHPDYFRFVFMTNHGRPIHLGAGGLESGGRGPVIIAQRYAEAYFEPLYGGGWHSRFLTLWSAAHGLTLMLVCGTLQPPGDPLALVRAVVDGCL